VEARLGWQNVRRMSSEELLSPPSFCAPSALARPTMPSQMRIWRKSQSCVGQRVC
jgi:hypothetical protein